MNTLYHPGSRRYVSAAIGILMISAVTGGVAVRGQSKYKESTITYGGVVRGTVTLHGDISNVARMTVTKDNKTCGTYKPFSCLRVGKKMGMANTFVYLEGITEGKPFEQSPSYTLHQQKCEYVPHTMVVPLGAQIEIVNNDPILHNVHTYVDGKPPTTLFNIAQPVKGVKMKTRPMERPGLVLATCDAGHPWMFAHVMVADHPYYTITDANGNFAMEHVPPGTYMLHYWHEGIAITHTVFEQGKVSKYEFEPSYEDVRQITVTPEQETIANFEISLR